ncbi:thioredoxin family protein [Hydrogenobacter thermophilus]|uniref:thioredoxin family protein n=1 Tax=Hydrogenobacter thermophilus TaxID=940 RepID=UPI0030F7E7ED
MEIKIYGGPDCRSCQELFERIRVVAEDLGLKADIQKITDIEEIINFNALPVLMIDGIIKHIGKPIPTVSDIKVLLTSASVNP